MDLDIDNWVRRESTIVELRQMREACEIELSRRAYVCGMCGADVPTALPLRHPAHAASCARYASTVTY